MLKEISIGKLCGISDTGNGFIYHYILSKSLKTVVIKKLSYKHHLMPQEAHAATIATLSY